VNNDLRACVEPSHIVGGRAENLDVRIGKSHAPTR
jgi:hypothetical protein